MKSSATSKYTSIQLVKQLLRDPERKPIPKIIMELAYITMIFKTNPRHYFSRFLFKKERTNITDYFPSKVLYNIKPHFNERGATEVLENKLFFNFFYQQFNISLPKILMYNHRNVFVVRNEIHHVNTPAEFVSLLAEVFKSNQITDSIYIKRTYGTYGGNKVFKLLVNELYINSESVNDLFEEVIRSSYLFQETIRQHPEMNKLNSSCLNTIRMDTFIDQDGKIDIISAGLRTSLNNNYVDNITSGGCGIMVDLATGKLVGKGKMSLKAGGIKMPIEHPVTHIVFNGFAIPFFDQVKQLVLEVAGYVPNLRLIGWDIAITESGPILIEGNSDYDMTGTDTYSNGARSNPVFRKVLKEIDMM